MFNYKHYFYSLYCSTEDLFLPDFQKKEILPGYDYRYTSYLSQPITLPGDTINRIKSITCRAMSGYYQNNNLVFVLYPLTTTSNCQYNNTE